MESRDNLRFCDTFKSISVSLGKLVNDDENQTVDGLETKRGVIPIMTPCQLLSQNI